ncbi:MAG: hypothetical protein ACP5JG_00870 [Anaerolineae bacterium]
MFKHKVVFSLLVALALLVILPLTACRPEDGVSGGPEPPSGDVSGGRAYVDDLQLLIMESFPVQVRAVITGQLSDGCTEVQETRVEYDAASQTFRLHIETYRDPEKMCTQALVPFEESVSLDVEGLSAGTYTVEIQDETATFELAVDNVLPED